MSFDDVTTLLGPNGVGKSTILRALDWFFNGSRSSQLTIDDVFMTKPETSISVAVEFDDLTDDDRERLGSYVSETGTFTAKKQWTDGVEKTIGRSRVFEPFAEIRSAASATEMKTKYNAFLSTDGSGILPKWASQAKAIAAMDEWEASNPTRLVDADVERANHFFGFAGQAAMSGMFDFIFVSADLRASEETVDNKGSIIGLSLIHI